MRARDVAVAVVLVACLLPVGPAMASGVGPFPLAVTPRGANGYGIVGAVYRSRANEYAFFSTEPPDAALAGIYLHRVGARGSSVGSPIRVTPPPEPDARVGETAVAYDPRHDSYLVVFNWWRGDDFSRGLLALRVAGDGRPIGQPVQVTPRADPRNVGPWNCALRYDSRRGRFLMLWQEGDLLQARVLTTTGHPLGRAATPLPARFARLATGLREWDTQYNPRTGSWLVAWTANDPEGPMSFARRLGAVGAGAGRVVRLGSENLGRRPELTFNRRTGRFLLVTTAPGHGTHYDSLHVTALSSAGRPASRGLTMVAPAYAPEVFSAGIVSGTRSGRALLSWSYLDDEGHAGLFFYPRVQLVDGTGRHTLGQATDILALPPTPPFTEPNNGVLSLIYNSRLDEFMVVFMRQDPQTWSSGIFGYIVRARP